MPNKGKEYKGELAKSIKVKSPPRRGRINQETKESHENRKEEHLEEVFKEIAKEDRKKVLLLLEHYNINLSDNNPWAKLAMALANKHVTGFQVVIEGAGSGRKQELDIVEEALFYLEFEDCKDVMELNNQTKPKYSRIKITDSLVAGKLAKQKAIPKKTIQNQYIKSKSNPYIKIINKVEGAAPKKELREYLKKLISDMKASQE